MSSHWHDSSAGTQNQGNVLGARPCVRQSKLFRSYESGNGVKGLLGTPHLVWDETRQQGAYHNQPVWDHETGGGGYYSRASQQQYPTAAPEQQSNAARTYERSSQAYGSGYDHLPPHYHQQHQHQQHQRQQPPPPPSSGNSLLDDINAKRARNLAERHASIEADRLDDLRVSGPHALAALALAAAAESAAVAAAAARRTSSRRAARSCRWGARATAAASPPRRSPRR